MLVLYQGIQTQRRLEKAYPGTYWREALSLLVLHQDIPTEDRIEESYKGAFRREIVSMTTAMISDEAMTASSYSDQVNLDVWHHFN